jgi:NAD(P)-dependent dehydrogenase (short-subunit alcohol dehydrogenase family)
MRGNANQFVAAVKFCSYSNTGFGPGYRLAGIRCFGHDTGFSSTGKALLLDAFDFSGSNILITHADRFMGPALVETFRQLGGNVTDSNDSLEADGEAEALVRRTGSVDILVANLAIAAPQTLATEVTADEWQSVFRSMVNPLQALIQAVLPQMIDRRRGKILLMGSAAALRGINRTSSYCAARGAQISYIQAVGVEVARHNVQVNAIAQNFVDNETYFPAEVQENPAFQKRLKSEVPLGRLVSKNEDAMLAAYLCSAVADCYVGQVFPLCGGWVAR